MNQPVNFPVPTIHPFICRSLLAGDSADEPLAGVLNRLQAGSYISDKLRDV
jgi:hypothetical protein